MSSKPSPKSPARKSRPASKTANVARSTKPRLAPKSAVQPSEPAKEPEKTRFESAPAAEFSNEVLEFLTAVDVYKRKHSRKFPHLSELFAIVKSLGYHKSA
jgi:hypothetical protein